MITFHKITISIVPNIMTSQYVFLRIMSCPGQLSNVGAEGCVYFSSTDYNMCRLEALKMILANLWCPLCFRGGPTLLPVGTILCLCVGGWGCLSQFQLSFGSVCDKTEATAPPPPQAGNRNPLLSTWEALQQCAK